MSSNTNPIQEFENLVTVNPLAGTSEASQSFLINPVDVLSNTQTTAMSTLQAFLNTTPSGGSQTYNASLQSYLATINGSTSFLPSTSGTTSAYTNFLNTLQQSPASLSPTDAQNLLNAFETEYSSVVNAGTDLSLINPPPDLSTQFQNAFSAFLNNYQYAPAGNQSTTTFLQKWSSFLTQTAVVQTGNDTQPNANGTSITLIAYQQVFNAFLGANSGTPGFSPLVNEFYQQELTKTGNGNPSNGYFIPSQAAGDWITFMEQKMQGTPTALSASSVTTAQTKKVLILNKIFQLLVQMIGAIQNVAAAQASRLNFLSQWQTAYTDLQNQIHYFAGTQAEGEIGGSGNSTRNARDAVNQVNQTFTQQIQGLNGVVQNNAKSLQSNVNQSNDESNNQASLCDTIIQQLNTLLQSIFSSK